jgi:hypothetical protein
MFKIERRLTNVVTQTIDPLESGEDNFGSGSCVYQRPESVGVGGFDSWIVKVGDVISGLVMVIPLVIVRVHDYFLSNSAPTARRYKRNIPYLPAGEYVPDQIITFPDGSIFDGCEGDTFISQEDFEAAQMDASEDEDEE